MKPKVIGLCGRKRSGKTSAANIIQEFSGPMVLRTGFAGPIKSMVGRILPEHLDCDKEIIRPLYQAVGEVFKDLYGQHYWIDQLEAAWESVDDHYEMLLIDDVRFPVEQRWISAQGGIVIRIDRPHTDTSSDDHPSETNVDSVECDHTVTNDGDKTKLAQTLIDLFERL